MGAPDRLSTREMINTQSGGAASGPEGQSQPQGGAAKDQGDVVDAEFEVVDEDKKK